MSKFLGWVAAFLGIFGLAFFGNGDVGLGILFVSCAIIVAALLLWHQQEKDKQAQQEEAQVWNQGIPVVYSFDPGHFTGAYEYEKWHAGYSDSAGGWDVYGGVKNVSPYIINYIHFYVYPIDRIGSRVAKTECWKYTGPFEPRKMTLIRSQHHWYGLSVDSVVVEKIVVDYNILGTQVTTAPASAFALHGNGTSHESWVARKPAQDGTWDLKSVIYYQAEKPSDRVILSVVPLDADGNELASAMEFSARSHKEKNSTVTVWWSGIWKGLPVARVRIQRLTIEYTDGTKQTITF